MVPAAPVQTSVAPATGHAVMAVVTGDDVAAAPVPLVLAAATLKVYVLLLISPVTVTGLVVVVTGASAVVPWYGVTM